MSEKKNQLIGSASRQLEILLISPTPSHPQTSGNRARVYSLLRTLIDIGHSVHFAHVQQTLGDVHAMHMEWKENFYSIPYEEPSTRRKNFSRRFDKRVFRKLQALIGDDPHFTYQIDDWFDDSTKIQLCQLAETIQPDVVIVEYVFFSKVLEYFDQKTLKIIDTHDIFADRYKIFLKQGQRPRWFSTTRDEEDKGLSRADIVMAIQDREASIFRNRLQSCDVITVGHFVPIVEIPRSQETRNILFFASNNAVNLHTLENFLDTTFPLMRSRDAAVKLVLAGTICDEVEDMDGCFKLGVVTDVSDAYAQADVVINPIEFGTGLKIKNIEALGYGRPLVTTSLGATGLESGIDHAFQVADTPEDFCDKVLCLLSDSSKYDFFASNAHEFVENWNQVHLNQLKSILACDSLCSH